MGWLWTCILTRYKAEIIWKAWAIFTDMCFFPSFLSKTPTPVFSQKNFFVSHILFFLERCFFLLLLTLCTRGSCSLLLSDEYVQGLHARFNIQGPEHCDDSKQGSYTELLLMRVYCWWFHTSLYLPQLFCKHLSYPALIFHLNYRRLIP